MPFDAAAAVVESLCAAVGTASPERLRELIAMQVERVKLTEDGEYEIEPVLAARPFFAAADDLLLAPPDGLGGSESKSVDALAWYASSA